MLWYIAIATFLGVPFAIIFGFIVAYILYRLLFVMLGLLARGVGFLFGIVPEGGRKFLKTVGILLLVAFIIYMFF